MDQCCALLKSSVMWRRFALFIFVVVSRDVSVTSPLSTNITLASSDNSADTFTIFDPNFPCNNNSRKHEWCAGRSANKDDAYETCRCVCNTHNGLFTTFLLEEQACVSNKDVYTLLGGEEL